MHGSHDLDEVRKIFSVNEGQWPNLLNCPQMTVTMRRIGGFTLGWKLAPEAERRNKSRRQKPDSELSTKCQRMYRPPKKQYGQRFGKMLRAVPRLLESLPHFARPSIFVCTKICAANLTQASEQRDCAKKDLLDRRGPSNRPGLRGAGESDFAQYRPFIYFASTAQGDFCSAGKFASAASPDATRTYQRHSGRTGNSAPSIRRPGFIFSYRRACPGGHLPRGSYFAQSEVLIALFSAACRSCFPRTGITW